MAIPDISMKHFGVTVELQVDDRHLYINPFERNDDRSPENADLIVSFIRAGVTELHLRTDLECHLAGLRLYGCAKTSHLTCPQLRNYVHSQSSTWDAAAKAKYQPLLKTKDAEGTLLELEDRMIGTEFLQTDDGIYGMALTIDDVDFHYYYIDDKFVDDFLDKRSTCAILVLENWKKNEATMRKIVLGDMSQVYYIVCDDLRKNDLKDFSALLPDTITKKIVCKKSKWKLTL